VAYQKEIASAAAATKISISGGNQCGGINGIKSISQRNNVKT